MSQGGKRSKRVKARPASSVRANANNCTRLPVHRPPKSVDLGRAKPQPASYDDDQSLRLAAEWHDARGAVALAYGAACSRLRERKGSAGPVPIVPIGPKLRELLERLERTESRLVNETPHTLSGVVEYLEIAEEILTERQTDPDGPMGGGPALEILSKVREALRLVEDGEAKSQFDHAA